MPPGDYSIVVERAPGKWVLITGSIGITAEFVHVASGDVDPDYHGEGEVADLS